MGHPFDLHRQSDDADAEPRRPGGLELSRRTLRALDIKDNDWIEAFNSNGALTARAVVSQRIREGTAFSITRKRRS